MAEGRRLREGARAPVPAGLRPGLPAGLAPRGPVPRGLLPRLEMGLQVRLWLGACLFALGGCASIGPPGVVDGFHQDTEIGYRVAMPDGKGSGWKWIGVDGAVLSFEQSAPEPGQRPAIMVFLLECGRGAENLSIVGRQLLIGIRDRALRQAAPIALRGSPGWMQVFDTLQQGVTVRVKTISVRSEGCTFDWALVAPGPFRAVEDQFDAWWSSFERLPDESTHSLDSMNSTGWATPAGPLESSDPIGSRGPSHLAEIAIGSQPPRIARGCS